jgi:hypothetical protein
MLNKSAILSAHEKSMLKHALFLYQKDRYDKQGQITQLQRDTLKSIVETLHLN